MTEQKQTFWDHLDVLRAALIRVALVFVVVAVAAFCFKEQLFALMTAPQSSDFCFYRWLNALLAFLPGSVDAVDSFSVRIVNTQLAGQFLLHMRMAMYVAVLIILPYIMFELFRFASPGLYQKERSVACRVLLSAYVMFMLGVVMSYLIVFPLTFRFLGTYQVMEEVDNLITLESYLGTLTSLNLMLGIVFELPVLCWLLGKTGLLTADLLRNYRRHAIVILMILAAIITPTADIFTLLVVTLPMYLLFEFGIFVVAHSR